MASRNSFDPNAIVDTVASAILLDLERETFDHSHSVPDLRAFRRAVHKTTLLKKYDPVGQDSLKLERACFDDFLSRHDELSRLDWSILTQSSMRSFSKYGSLHRILWCAKHIVKEILGPLDIEEVLGSVRHSSGVSRGVSFMDTSSTNKWSFPLTATTGSLPLLDRLFFWDESLRDAVILMAARDADVVSAIDLVDGSRATTVPKQADKRRFIAVEPTVNMLFQQGFMTVMYRRLKRFGYDMSVLPELHQKLARQGSIDGKSATIDFSNASDCVSLELVRLLLPADWFSYLCACRSTHIEVDKKVIPLSVYATMGNATTFPIETLVFLACALALWNISETGSAIPDWTLLNRRSIRELISVFGDDCIMPTRIAFAFCDLMGLLGFTVNTGKSFLEGPFRESCGGDYYYGRDVRGLYIRAPVSTDQSSLEPWLYTLLNHTLEKYILYFGEVAYVYDKEVLRVFRQLFRENHLRIKVVPPDSPTDSGLVSQDWRRILSNYRFNMSPISTGDHGTVAYKAVAYRYPSKTKADDGILYNETLRRLRLRPEASVWDKIYPHLKDQPLDDVEEFLRVLRKGRYSPLRKRGKYVVVNRLTSFWSLG